jgi:hypothetical protein
MRNPVAEEGARDFGCGLDLKLPASTPPAQGAPGKTNVKFVRDHPIHPFIDAHYVTYCATT